MRKLFFFTLTLTFSLISNVYCQENNIGITGGLFNGGEKFKSGSSTATASDTGFYLGINYKMPLSEKFTFNPEINYGNLNNASFGFISARVLYYPFNKFYIQGGPQYSYIFEALGDSLKKGGVDFSLGLGYEITDHFFIQGRYSFEQTNRSNFDIEDVSSRLRWIFIGVGYNF